MIRAICTFAVILSVLHALCIPAGASAQSTCSPGTAGCLPKETITATVRVYTESGQYITIYIDTNVLPDGSTIQRTLPVSLGWLPPGTYTVKLLKVSGRINVVDGSQRPRVLRLTPRTVWLAATTVTVTKLNELTTVALVIQPPVTQPPPPTRTPVAPSTATPVPTSTVVPVATPTATPVPTATPQATSTPVATATSTPPPAATATATRTSTSTPSVQLSRDCTWRGHPARVNSVAQMSLLSPFVRYIWDDFICLSWTEVEGATSYVVVIRDLLRGEKIVFLQQDFKSTKIKIPASSWDNSTYMLYVQPVFGTTPRMWVNRSFNLCKTSAGCVANPHDGGQ